MNIMRCETVIDACSFACALCLAPVLLPVYFVQVCCEVDGGREGPEGPEGMEYRFVDCVLRYHRTMLARGESPSYAGFLSFSQHEKDRSLRTLKNYKRVASDMMDAIRGERLLYADALDFCYDPRNASVVLTFVTLLRYLRTVYGCVPRYYTWRNYVTIHDRIRREGATGFPLLLLSAKK